MFKTGCLVFFILFMIGCNSGTIKDSKKENNNAVPVQNRSLESFADSLVRLDKFAPETIETAGNYFQQLVPADTTLADSAAVMLLTHIYGVVDTVNKKLWNDTTDYMDLVYPGGPPPSEKQKQFQQSLNKNHLKLQGNGEGDVLAVPDYDWFTGVVQPATSATVDGYLSLLSKEEKEPAMLDAALAVEMKELIARLISSEKLMSEKLPKSFSEDVVRKNKFYTDVLLIGSDNTPAFEDESTLKLTPEFKQGYDHLLAMYPASTAAGNLKAWLAAIKAKDRKKIEERKASAYQ